MTLFDLCQEELWNLIINSGSQENKQYSPITLKNKTLKHNNYPFVILL